VLLVLVLVLVLALVLAPALVFIQLPEVPPWKVLLFVMYYTLCGISNMNKLLVPNNY